MCRHVLRRCRLPVADDPGTVRLSATHRGYVHRPVVASLVHVDSHARQGSARQWHGHRAERVHRPGALLPDLALSARIVAGIATRAVAAAARGERRFDLARYGQSAYRPRAHLVESI